MSLIAGFLLIKLYCPWQPENTVKAKKTPQKSNCLHYSSPFVRNFPITNNESDTKIVCACVCVCVFPDIICRQIVQTKYYLTEINACSSGVNGVNANFSVHICFSSCVSDCVSPLEFLLLCFWLFLGSCVSTLVPWLSLAVPPPPSPPSASWWDIKRRPSRAEREINPNVL